MSKLAASLLQNELLFMDKGLSLIIFSFPHFLIENLLTGGS